MCRDENLPESKTESRVTETSGIAGETRSVGNPGGHFAESGHDDVDDETDHGVSNENGGGTKCCQSTNCAM